MSQKKILITGISGSGGSYLAEYVIRNHPEIEIFGISRWGSTKTDTNIKNIKDKITLIECDLTDLSSTIRALDYCHPNMIFNLASHANVKVCFENPLAVLNNNIFSTANLLEAVKLVCPNAIFQQCSTSEVYGNPVDFPMTETHQMKPVNPYSVSKLAQESLSYAYHKSWGLKVIITRAFAYLNPKRHDLFATSFALQVARIEQGKQKVLKHGNLDSIRTLIDVRDMMRAYWIACEFCEFGVPYNIGGKDILTVGDFLSLLIKKAKCEIPTEQDTNLLRPVDITRQVPDTTKFDTLTKFTPEFSFDESVEFLLNEARKVVACE